MAANITDVSDKTFDYLIIGGGTTGLTIAARLTEDPSVSVAVIEAGKPNLDDPNILVPAQYGRTFGDPKYDWAFQTIPQKNVNNKVALWNRGKGLGGSSAMNFYCWTKPSAGDIDAIENLGNPGWNWNDFLKYSLLAEKFHAAVEEHSAVYPHTYNPMYRGTSGPILTSVPHHVHTIDLLFQKTFMNKGCNQVVDPYGGDINGTFMAAATIDQKTWTRSYAATAHYQPNKGRPNLTVLTEAVVSRILFEGGVVDEKITATGIEFVHDGKTCKAMAKKEVILSAGTIKSPQILELSGIGRADVLSRIGVDLKVDLPGVGENVQDHIMSRIALELDPNTPHETLDLLKDPEYAAEAMKLHAEGKGLFRTSVTSFAFLPLSTINPKESPKLIEGVTKKVDAAKKEGKLPPGLAEQLDIQLETLKSNTLPDFEFLAFPGLFAPPISPEPGKRYVTLNFILQHPFSRGYIHAISANSNDQPEIDANYYGWDFDLEAMVQQFKFFRSLCDVEPFKSGVHCEVLPGPECQTDEQIREFIKNDTHTTWHTIGSCSMLPRDKQGVVDPQLKVYGTTNLRVADISIVPIHLTTHTQSIAYMIGEKASDIIAGKCRV